MRGGDSVLLIPQIHRLSFKDICHSYLATYIDDSWLQSSQCKQLTKPWVSNQMMELIHKRKNMYRAAKKSPENVQLADEYKRFRNQVTNQLRQAKITYMTDAVAESRRLGEE